MLLSETFSTHKTHKQPERTKHGTQEYQVESFLLLQDFSNLLSIFSHVCPKLKWMGHYQRPYTLNMQNEFLCNVVFRTLFIFSNFMSYQLKVYDTKYSGKHLAIAMN